jgi:hypothetical protein
MTRKAERAAAAPAVTSTPGLAIWTTETLNPASRRLVTLTSVASAGASDGHVADAFRSAKAAPRCGWTSRHAHRGQGT